MSKYFIYGLDPASRNDYFGVVGHELQPGMLPKLRVINALRDASFDRIYHYLVNDLFARMPPFYITADYTNEKTFTDMLVERYGNRKVKAVNFTRENKLMLKEDGLSILKQGYRFPNPTKLKDQNAAMLVSVLVAQLKAEQVLQTSRGKPTFDHPVGAHNDLSCAWELSIHGCLKFMLKWKRAKGNDVFVISKKYGHGDSDIYGSGVPDRAGVTVTDRSVYYPGQGR